MNSLLCVSPLIPGFFILYALFFFFVRLVLTCFLGIILLEILGEEERGRDMKTTKKNTETIKWRNKPLSVSPVYGEFGRFLSIPLYRIGGRVGGMRTALRLNKRPQKLDGL